MKDVAPYAVPRAAAPIDLRLDANEGPPPAVDLFEATSDVELLRRYPSAAELEAELAACFGVRPEQVLVTAGADDALLRVCLAFLGPGRELVVPTPAFEMIPRYARLAGATVRGVPEDAGGFPCAAVLAALHTAGPRLGLAAIVSPSNPTGSVASAADLRAVAAAAARVPEALVLVDAAYAEFAEEDLSACALTLENAVCVRTFSKAWGLAGARVGYALGPAGVIRRLRAAGNPYAVAGPSLALARAALASSPVARNAYLERVRVERRALAVLLARLGARPRPSQANFVLADVDDPLGLRDGLAALGIGIRVFAGGAGLERAVRITCPGDPDRFARLEAALEATLKELGP